MMPRFFLVGRAGSPVSVFPILAVRERPGACPSALVPMQHPEPFSEPFSPQLVRKSVRELHRELRSYQRRLGTAAEQEGDFERVLLLAHELNNQITAAYLREAAESLPELSPILTAVGKRVLGR